MADLVKKIKIKKQDGTFTDYIPIGAEAQNVSTNDGESVQLKLNKKPYYYNSVANMKADTKLKVGDMVATLGYYEENDGGASIYQIVDDSTLVDDGGSVHELSNGLYAKLIYNEELNVKQFGCYGNGTNDDTDCLNRALSIPNVSIYIPKGTYNVSSTLYLSGTNNLYTDKNATIKAIEGMNYLLFFNNSDNRALNKEISGGVFDGNDLVDTIFIAQNYRGLSVNNMTLKNFITNGLQSKVVGKGGVELIARDLYIWNAHTHQNSLAINNTATDAIFTDIIIKNTHYGVLTKDGLFSKIHGWIEDPKLLPNSYFIKSNDKATIVNQCYADTYQYPFISTFLSLNVVSCLVYYNSNIYTPELQETYPIIIFKSELDIYNLNSYGSFKATNNTIANQNDVNIKLTNRHVKENIFANNIIAVTTNCDYSNYAIDSNNYVAINSDINNLTYPGRWWVNGAANLPTGVYEYGILEVIATPKTDRALMNGEVHNSLSGTNVAHLYQMYIPLDASPSGIYIRSRAGGNWQPWKKATLNNI